MKRNLFAVLGCMVVVFLWDGSHNANAQCLATDDCKAFRPPGVPRPLPGRPPITDCFPVDPARVVGEANQATGVYPGITPCGRVRVFGIPLPFRCGNVVPGKTCPSC